MKLKQGATGKARILTKSNVQTFNRGSSDLEEE
jgi:hypothetical protein